ncbi:MAG: hypothetical protein HY859_02695, partial [Caulobacterales bacterium]|nr:hypothetical protein [Caulobacterales bacterium]
WGQAWNRWLAARFADRDTLDAALGDLTDSEDPATGSVTLPAELNGQRRAHLCQVFLVETERAMIERMRRAVRDELRCQALVTNLNYGFSFPSAQGARVGLDYVDDHFYVDHPPQFNLPVAVRYANPIRDGAPGGCTSAGMRIWGKPFTISEYDYTCPGRYRGMGGLLTGALAGLQDWDGLWRFAYAHKDVEVSAPAPMDWFNLANDPLSLAGDRAAILLFLRRDIDPAPHRAALVLPEPLLRDPPAHLQLGGLDWLAWTTRIGCAVVDDPTRVPAGAVAVPVRGSHDRAAVTRLLAGTVALPPAGTLRSETGAVAMDVKSGVLCIDTPRTAGGYADAGRSFATADATLRVEVQGAGATVFVSSLDGSPIRTAKRLLVTHLTDLQDTGIRYNESARTTLLAWGKAPHLVLDGSAIVRLARADAAHCQVWALSTGGHRKARVEATVDGGILSIPVRVRGAEGARMLYEVVAP